MIKAVILDFDHTFYEGENPEIWGAYLIEFLSEYINDFDKTVKFIKKYKVSGHSSTASIATGLIEEFGTAQQFVEHQQTHILPLKENMVVVKPQVIENLSKHFILSIVSNSPVEYVEYYLEKFGIDKNCFTYIYQNNFLTHNPSKGPYYQKIMDDLKLDASEICVIGDSFESDLLPAQRLGMNVKQVNSVQEFTETCNNLVKQAINI